MAKVPKQLEHRKVVCFLPTKIQGMVDGSARFNLWCVEGEQGRILCKHVGNKNSSSLLNGEFKAAIWRRKRVQLMKSLLGTLLPCIGKERRTRFATQQGMMKVFPKGLCLATIRSTVCRSGKHVWSWMGRGRRRFGASFHEEVQGRGTHRVPLAPSRRSAKRELCNKEFPRKLSVTYEGKGLFIGEKEVWIELNVQSMMRFRG